MTPPPLIQLEAAYNKANPHKHLRIGQWFFNTYLSGTVREIKYPYNLDLLYNTTDIDVIHSILKKMYEDYQWPIF